MIIWYTALRRVCKPSYLAALVVCVLLTVGSGWLTLAGVWPPSGICDLDQSAISQAVVSHLTAHGFISCDDPQELRRLVEQGELDCGAVLPFGFGGMVAAGVPEGEITFLSSPSSILPELAKSHISAAVFRLRAPYIAALSLEGTDVSAEELAAQYAQHEAEGFAFTFYVEEVHTAAAGSSGMVMGCAAILLYVLMIFPSCDRVEDTFRAMLRRIGLRQTLWQILLPETVVRGVLAAGSMSLALLPLGAHALVPAVWLYSIMLGSLGLLLEALLPERQILHTLAALTVLASAALCPVVADVSLFSQALGALRCLLPPYWLWLICAGILAWIPAAAAAPVLACAVWRFRYRRKKYA